MDAFEDYLLQALLHAEKECLLHSLYSKCVANQVGIAMRPTARVPPPPVPRGFDEAFWGSSCCRTRVQSSQRASPCALKGAVLAAQLAWV